MRAAWLALVVLALAPSATAQDLPPLIETRLAPLPGPVAPLGEPVATTATTRVACALAESPSGLVVSYEVRESPAWATVVVSPGTETAGMERCDAGFMELETRLVVTVSDQAPAFRPEDVQLVARVGSREASATTPVEATWFSILDVQLAESMDVVAPGHATTFDVVVTSFGNAPVEVVATMTQAPATLDVAVPAPVRLGSKQHGENDVQRTLEVRVRAPVEDSLVNRVEAFTLHLVARLPATGAEGDASDASFVVTIRSAALQQNKLVPSAPLLVLLAAGLAALGRR